MKRGPVLSEEMGSPYNSCIVPSHSLTLYFSYLGWAVVIPAPDHPSIEEARLQYWWLGLCGGATDGWTTTSAHHLLVKVERRPEVRLETQLLSNYTCTRVLPALGLHLFLLLLPFLIHLIPTPLLAPHARYLAVNLSIVIQLIFWCFFLLVKNVKQTFRLPSGFHEHQQMLQLSMTAIYFFTESRQFIRSLWSEQCFIAQDALLAEWKVITGLWQQRLTNRWQIQMCFSEFPKDSFPISACLVMSVGGISRIAV